MELDEVRSIQDCTECATVDAYGEYKQATGWLTCLEDVFDDIQKVKVAGEVVTLKGFDLEHDVVVVAICEKNRKKLRLTLDSIELIDPTPVQKLWLEAWLAWR